MAYGLTALYTYYYTDRSTADIYKFFDDSAVIHQIAYSDISSYLKLLFGLPIDSEIHNLISNTQHWDASAVWGATGNRLMSRVHLLIRWVSFGNIWVHTVFFSSMSVLGFMWVYRALSPYFKNPIWIFLPFLMPSVLFWSSGMLKEAILVFAVGLAFNSLYLFHKHKYTLSIIMIVVCVGLLAVLKIYLLVVAMPVVLSLLVWQYLPFVKEKSYLLSISISLFVAYILFHILSNVFLDHSFVELLILRYNDFTELAIQQEAGSLLSDYKISQDTLGIWFWNAFKNTWLMPWPWSGGGIMIKIAGLEHLVFSVLLILSIYFGIKTKLPKSQLVYFLALFLFSVLLFQLIGLTVPVLGAIVRYKMPAILFASLFFAFIFDSYFSKRTS